MKIAIVDVYPFINHRLIKDTAGGYGTGNNFGDTYFSKILNIFVDRMIGMPPMFLIYISSIFKEDSNNDVFYTRDINDKKLLDSDFVIFSSSIIAHETEISALEKIKDKKVFITGVFASTFPDKYKFKNAKVIKNEPETFFHNLKKENKLNKKYLDDLFENDEYQIENNFQTDLDELPFPDWKSYSKNFPLRNNFFSIAKNVAVPILATRGCPYSCFNYCTYPLQQGRKVRARSPKNICDEIKFWMKELNTNKFVFRDPVFSINKKHTVELCNEIINQNLKITFLIETHLNNLDDEMLDLLFKSGLRMVYVGIESADENVLSDMNRFTIKSDKQYQIIEKCEKKGVSVKTMFMIGNPADDEKTILKTIEYAKYLPNNFAQFSIFTPYPGTPVFKKFEEKIITKKLEDFNQYNLTFDHKNLTIEGINKLKSAAYFKYYFNINKIFKIFKYFIKSLYV